MYDNGAETIETKRERQEYRLHIDRVIHDVLPGKFLTNSTRLFRHQGKSAFARNLQTGNLCRVRIRISSGLLSD